MTDKKKIIIVSTDFGTEQAEIVQPADKLRALGHDVTVATPTGEDVRTLEGDREPASVIPTDVRLSEAVGPFDVVVLPGGTLNSDAARMDEDVRDLVRRQADEGRAVAAICHAPWVLIESGVAAGKTMTGYDSVRTDLRNAGATVVDESVKVCTANGWTLITSRTPRDLDNFIDAIDRL
ncbi:DJ-1/PfpI family protein [Corynebacterium sp. TAE3-ERU16]|uniref:DJ-1/PfpI family protein n=1 Tax=Corynebacterium sp. TAE3-ERU16 TaxID=2849493 RepID=UPI001C451368|nr:DJ-1/PfpI family protein [Corynebacterium sp. TAE3-ERU16]MBV7292596.1 DJ-1/PfpI family protein [Corynebacterium sp. TAE3-ERU16]